MASQPVFSTAKRLKFRRLISSGAIGAFALVMFSLALTGATWRAIAYVVVALFGFLVALAVYFWGAVIFGGLLETIGYRRNPVPWSIGPDSLAGVPEHDIDPGLELLAAGILVYRFGEIKPQAHFRAVPLANVRAIRPFVVARTGDARPYRFIFSLSDEQDRVRFSQELTCPLNDVPGIIMPNYRLSLPLSHNLLGQRWSLQVRSGVTVVTTFRFAFVDGEHSAVLDLPASAAGNTGGTWLHDVLPHLLDEAVKQDVLLDTQEIVLQERLS